MKKEIKQHTQEEILNALHVIQDVCESHTNQFSDKFDTNCKKCPLCMMIEDTPICNITDLAPDSWSIDDDSDIVWRAFKK